MVVPRDHSVNRNGNSTKAERGFDASIRATVAAASRTTTRHPKWHRTKS
jgi:hypothetical protein